MKFGIDQLLDFQPHFYEHRDHVGLGPSLFLGQSLDLGLHIKGKSRVLGLTFLIHAYDIQFWFSLYIPDFFAFLASDSNRHCPEPCPGLWSIYKIALQTILCILVDIYDATLVYPWPFFAFIRLITVEICCRDVERILAIIEGLRRSLSNASTMVSLSSQVNPLKRNPLIFSIETTFTSFWFFCQYFSFHKPLQRRLTYCLSYQKKFSVDKNNYIFYYV
jgi:hypothetical protein